jgi:hypothetical protein
MNLVCELQELLVQFLREHGLLSLLEKQNRWLI